MTDFSPALRRYFVRFLFRLGVFSCALLLYFTRREALDFTAEHSLFSPVSLFWGILSLSFLLQLSPRSRVSRGCLKQFPQHFSPRGIPTPATLSQLNRGAARVALVWTLPNLLFAALYAKGILRAPELLLLTAFYYLCDVICIVFFCPFQTFLMKNKCCVTCRIFAWGTIMTVTPLLFVPCLYAGSLTALALVCTVRWEVAYRRHPERFCEESNAFLSCADCTDRLCKIKRTLKKAVRSSEKSQKRRLS